jgi:hypothetical protein
MRRIASNHLLQHWGVDHSKYVVLDDVLGGFAAATILTGNLVSTENMTNLGLTIPSQQAVDFLTKRLEPNSGPKSESGLSSSGHLTQPLTDFADKVSLVMDYGNYGNPGQISEIGSIAERMIDPNCETITHNGELSSHKPTKIYLVSQYVPDGKLLNALLNAAAHGAEVQIPLQPAEDYRLQSPGYRTMYWNFRRKFDDELKTWHRENPSHIKCLIVEYDDGTRSMLFGTDNFLTILQKYVRNTELAIHIDHAEKGEIGYDMIGAVMEQLSGGGRNKILNLN